MMVCIHKHDTNTHISWYLYISGDDVVLDLDDEAKQQVVAEVRCHEELRTGGRYLSLEYETLQQYLDALRTIATTMNCLGPRACFFLAAAVSDFYIPAEKVHTQ